VLTPDDLKEDNRLNIKEATKIKKGALVRESFDSVGYSQGIVLKKRHVRRKRFEKMIGLEKEERYLITVKWINHFIEPGTVQEISSWDLMPISHAE
jgi:hypothetical protein